MANYIVHPLANSKDPGVVEARQEIDSLVAALTLWPCVPVDVRESYCLTDGHFLALIRTEFSEALKPGSSRGDCVMAEGRICLSPGPYRTNQILLGPCASNTCRYHFNSWIGGANSYGYVRNENLLVRLRCDCQAVGDLGVNPDESAEGETRFASSRTVERVLNEENSDCG